LLPTDTDGQRLEKRHRIDLLTTQKHEEEEGGSNTAGLDVLLQPLTKESTRRK